MVFKRCALWLGMVALFSVGSSVAAEAPAPGAMVKAPTVESVIIAKISKAIPRYKVTSVRPSPIPGLYLVQVGGSDLLVTADGSKFIQGDIFNVTPTGYAKWEDPALVAERKNILATMNPKDAIVFKPAKTKAVVYVFTDVDCGFCRKLNSEMAEYNKLGIEIRYLAFPRSGYPSPSADKLVTAWCSKDKQSVLTKIKEGYDVPAQTCVNPVEAQFELGVRLGVNATPALWMPDGSIKLGYLPPSELAKELKIL